MKIKRIKNLRVNSYQFAINWNLENIGGHVSYTDKTIGFNTKDTCDGELFESICHELFEICAIEMHVRFNRNDCRGDYIFVYDHRQHDTMINMFAGLLSQFLA